MNVPITIEELERQNSEWLAMRKLVHRRARIELDRAYMRRLKELRRVQGQRVVEKVKREKIN